MKKVRLQKVKLNMFQGIRQMDLTLPGDYSIITGMNEAGKSSIAVAVWWVLTGKSIDGKSPDSFGIKSTDLQGNVFHNEKHFAEITLDVNGKELKLKKSYEEVWSKGYDSKLMSHKTFYYWNDTNVSATDFSKRLAGEIADEKTIMMLMSPHHFAEGMKWQERRPVLIEMSGYTDDAQVIATYKVTGTIAGRTDLMDLTEYPAIVGTRGQKDTINNLKLDRKLKMKESDGIPSRIDENTKRINPVSDSWDDLQDQESDILDQIQKIKSEDATDLGVKRLNDQLSVIAREMDERKIDHAIEKNKVIADDQKRLSEMQTVYTEKVGEAHEFKMKIQDQEFSKKSAERNLENQKSEYDRVKAVSPKELVLPEPDSGVCHACGQDLPHSHEDHEKNIEKMKADYSTYLERFNTGKAEKLKSIMEQVSSYQETIEKITESIKKDRAEYDDLHGGSVELSEKIEALRDEINEKTSNYPAVDVSDLESKKDNIQKQIKKAGESKSLFESEKNEKIKSLQDKLESIREKVSIIRGNREAEARNRELSEEHKKLGKGIAEIDRKLQIIKDFNIARSELITQNVNKLFKKVEWQLYDVQVNGEVNNNMCEPTVGGVHYSKGLNHANRVNAGIDIINSLNDHYQLYLPVFVDNRESVQGLDESNTQIINLKVTDDYQLRSGGDIVKYSLVNRTSADMKALLDTMEKRESNAQNKKPENVDNNFLNDEIQF